MKKFRVKNLLDAESKINVNLIHYLLLIIENNTIRIIITLQ